MSDQDRCDLGLSVRDKSGPRIDDLDHRPRVQPATTARLGRSGDQRQSPRHRPGTDPARDIDA
ncbi:MAG: hypothetical protein IT446_04930 [Phycisphaerales bacterium]|nr:hypothetical protein [Phycisphaerales bacterium]